MSVWRRIGYTFTGVSLGARPHTHAGRNHRIRSFKIFRIQHLESGCPGPRGFEMRQKGGWREQSVGGHLARPFCSCFIRKPCLATCATSDALWREARAKTSWAFVGQAVQVI